MAELVRVFPDTSICFPISVLDLLLRCDENDLHRVVWTEDLLAELERVWVAHGARSADSARKVCNAVRSVFAGQHIPRDRYEHLIESMPGSDLDDHAHAAAAASVAPVVLLTANLKDFPSEPLARHGVTVAHPDGYFAGLFDRHPDDVAGVVQAMAANRNHPPMTPGDVADALERAGLRSFARKCKEGWPANSA